VNYGVLYSGNEKKIFLNRVMKTSSSLERMRGLLFRKPLKENEGLIIQKCSAIHTIGMQYPIDVIFLSDDFTVRKIFMNVKPYRFCISFGSSMVLETISGVVKKNKILENMLLLWEELNDKN
tara:strand:- start:1866 stop:2231 length:366 start_codon:yes stop_codon:yes gene_type:complete